MVLYTRSFDLFCQQIPKCVIRKCQLEFQLSMNYVCFPPSSSPDFLLTANKLLFVMCLLHQVRPFERKETSKASVSDAGSIFFYPRVVFLISKSKGSRIIRWLLALYSSANLFTTSFIIIGYRRRDHRETAEGQISFLLRLQSQDRSRQSLKMEWRFLDQYSRRDYRREIRNNKKGYKRESSDWEKASFFSMCVREIQERRYKRIDRSAVCRLLFLITPPLH